LSESKQPKNSPAEDARHKINVDESPRHQHTFETMGVEVLTRAPDEWMSDAPSSILSREPSAMLQRQSSSFGTAAARPATQTDTARPTFRGRDLSGVPAHAANHPVVQPKLTVGAADDQYEREADRVADQIMTMPAPVLAPGAPAQPPAAGDGGEAGGGLPPAQRQASDEEEENVQAKLRVMSITPFAQRIWEEQVPTKKPVQHAAEEEDEIRTRRASAIDSFEAGDGFENHLSAARGGGSSLPGPVRAFMEPRFGADFSGVRVHSGSESAQLNREVSAQAFTHGQDIFLGEGKSNLDSSDGRRLLAHELTHVAQQTGAAGMLDRIATVQASQTTDRLSSSTVTVQRVPRRRARTNAELTADSVRQQVTNGIFIDLPVVPLQGGAFWLLNGLNPTEMLEVLRLCGKDVRTKLLAHIADAEGHFDRPRIESALRSAAWGERTAGTIGLKVMDAIRNAGTGSFAGVWSLLAGKSRVKIIGTLRTLPRTMLTQLQTKLSEAPASDRTKFTEVISDLLGTGTDMQASDVIDLEGLSGLNRVMASIYNLRGQLIEEQARALDIPTHAAAGIMKVESGGRTFGEATDKTIVRFENHVFWREWGRAHVDDFNAHFDFDRSIHGKPWTQHRFRDSAAGRWEACHQGQAQEWRIMEFAASLSGKEAAYRSASWGAGQIMGFNAGMVGYRSAVAMAEAFNKAERPQITGIFEYIRANGLAPAVRRGDYLTLARSYNGRGQAPTYAANIRTAAAAYQRVTAGKIHVIPKLGDYPIPSTSSMLA